MSTQAILHRPTYRLIDHCSLCRRRSPLTSSTKTCPATEHRREFWNAAAAFNWIYASHRGWWWWRWWCLQAVHLFAFIYFSFPFPSNYFQPDRQQCEKKIESHLMHSGTQNAVMRRHSSQNKYKMNKIGNDGELACTHSTHQRCYCCVPLTAGVCVCEGELYERISTEYSPLFPLVCASIDDDFSIRLFLRCHR